MSRRAARLVSKCGGYFADEDDDDHDFKIKKKKLRKEERDSTFRVGLALESNVRRTLTRGGNEIRHKNRHGHTATDKPKTEEDHNNEKGLPADDLTLELEDLAGEDGPEAVDDSVVVVGQVPIPDENDQPVDIDMNMAANNQNAKNGDTIMAEDEQGEDEEPIVDLDEAAGSARPVDDAIAVFEGPAVEEGLGAEAHDFDGVLKPIPIAPCDVSNDRNMPNASSSMAAFKPVSDSKKDCTGSFLDHSPSSPFKMSQPRTASPDANSVLDATAPQNAFDMGGFLLRNALQANLQMFQAHDNYKYWMHQYLLFMESRKSHSS